MNRLLAVSVFIFISLYSNFSFADYVATGHFEGLVCKYFGTVCSYERLDAVKKVELMIQSRTTTHLLMNIKMEGVIFITKVFLNKLFIKNNLMVLIKN